MSSARFVGPKLAEPTDAAAAAGRRPAAPPPRRPDLEKRTSGLALAPLGCVARCLTVLWGRACRVQAMSDILAQVATNTETNKNTGNSILYECVQVRKLAG